MIFKIKILNQNFCLVKSFFCLFLSCFLLACGLRLGEEAPRISPYYLPVSKEEAFCSSLDYKEIITNYFVNKKEATQDKFNEVLDCLSLQISNIRSLLYNENFKREDILAILRDKDGVIDFKNFNQPLERMISHPEFISYKQYFFEVIDPSVSFNPEAFCHLFENKTEKESSFVSNMLTLFSEELKSEKDQEFYKDTSAFKEEILFQDSDFDLILAFVKKLKRIFVEMETRSESFLHFLSQSSVPLLSKKSLESEERALDFMKLLQLELSEEFFPTYNQFLKTQFNDKESSDKATFPETLVPLLQTLEIFSSEDQIYLLDIKYFLMTLYAVEFIFKNYDLDNNLVIDHSEVQTLSCLIEPFISMYLQEQVKDQWKIIQNFYSQEKVIHYILARQRIPKKGPWSVFSFWWFDPEGEIHLSISEVSILVNLFSELALEQIVIENNEKL